MVEHNPLLIASSDFNVELGPEGGSQGGQVIFEGTPRKLQTPKTQITSERSRRASSHAIRIHNLSHNNVKCVDFEVPTQATTAVVGVSGAGKSSAVLGALVPAIQSQLEGVSHPSIKTLKLPRSIGFVEVVTQTLATANRRSIVATAIGVFDSLRKQFWSTESAKKLA